MPGKRDPSQTTITVSMSKRFLRSVDEVCARALRGAPRAQIVRDALQDYLQRKFGIALPDEEVIAPPRTHRDAVRLNCALNETPGEASAPLPPRREVSYKSAKKTTRKKRKP